MSITLHVITKNRLTAYELTVLILAWSVTMARQSESAGWPASARIWASVREFWWWLVSYCRQTGIGRVHLLTGKYSPAKTV